MNKKLMFFILLLGILTFGTTISSYAESDWKIYQLNALVDKLAPNADRWSTNVPETFKIPYKVTNGTLQAITAEPRSNSLIIHVKNATDKGIFEIVIPTDLMDAKINYNM